MSGELRQYDPDQITISWSFRGGETGSIDLAEGLIDGPNAIVDAKDAPKWTRRSDRNSNVVRNRSRKKGGTLTLTYVAESEIQDLLTPLVIADGETGSIVGDIVIKDLNGSTIMTYIGAFIENDPDPAFGDTAADRVYVFGYADRVALLGGASAL